MWQSSCALSIKESDMPPPTTLDALQAQVLSLSKADRARLLDRLVASLDVDAEAEEEWEKLAEARDGELGSGKVAAVPLEDAMARLRARFPG
jgi:putative addiction module component (TIGR02574 family)